MTDFTQPVNWGADGPYLAAAIQLLNAIGALTLVYAFRYGQAIVVSPLTNAGAPLMTAVISLLVVGDAARSAQAHRSGARMRRCPFACADAGRSNSPDCAGHPDECRKARRDAGKPIGNTSCR